MGLFRKRIKDPVEGHATVVRRPPAPASTAATCTMQLDLDDVPGVERQVITHREGSMMTMRWPEVGMRVAVTVDRGNPERVDVHWESVFGEVRGGIFGRAAELLADGAGVELDLSKGPEGEREREDDVSARIMDLQAQFSRGEITYAELEEGARRAMGG